MTDKDELRKFMKLWNQAYFLEVQNSKDLKPFSLRNNLDKIEPILNTFIAEYAKVVRTSLPEIKETHF